MKRIFIVVTLMLLTTSAAVADDAFHPSRVRLLIHGKYLLQDTELRVHFIPAGNLVNGLAPLAYFGVGFKATNWLGIEPVLGWAFQDDEPILSVRFTPTRGKFYSWTDIEYRPSSQCGYYASQVEYRFLDWLHAGIESEGWGNYKNVSSWSFGGGPNLLLRFGKVGLDTTLHVRKLEGSVKPEFFLRVHLFL